MSGFTWRVTVLNLAGAQPAAAQAGPGYDIEISRMIPMRDGVKLEAWIFKPSNLKGRAPALTVLPDGSTVRLGEVIRRAFQRKHVQRRTAQARPECGYPLRILQDGATNSADARLKLTITPLNSSNYQKKYNTMDRIGYEKIEDARIANIKLFHDAERASRLTLPLATPVRPLDGH